MARELVALSAQRAALEKGRVASGSTSGRRGGLAEMTEKACDASGFGDQSEQPHGAAAARAGLDVDRQAALAERAREMRAALTPSEQVLWQAIRGRRLDVQFRRQVPLEGRYIADFYAAELRLVVEVDGGYHARLRARSDEWRTRWLERRGYTALRRASSRSH